MSEKDEFSLTLYSNNVDLTTIHPTCPCCERQIGLTRELGATFRELTIKHKLNNGRIITQTPSITYCKKCFPKIWEAIVKTMDSIRDEKLKTKQVKKK